MELGVNLIRVVHYILIKKEHKKGAVDNLPLTTSLAMLISNNERKSKKKQKNLGLLSKRQLLFEGNRKNVWNY